MENGANSTLFIAKVRKTDTGNYQCKIGPNDFYTINVQILKGNADITWIKWILPCLQIRIDMKSFFLLVFWLVDSKFN